MYQIFVRSVQKTVETRENLGQMCGWQAARLVAAKRWGNDWSGLPPRFFIIFWFDADQNSPSPSVSHFLSGIEFTAHHYHCLSIRDCQCIEAQSLPQTPFNVFPALLPPVTCTAHLATCTRHHLHLPLLSSLAIPFGYWRKVRLENRADGKTSSKENITRVCLF